MLWERLCKLPGNQHAVSLWCNGIVMSKICSNFWGLMKPYADSSHCFARSRVFSMNVSIIGFWVNLNQFETYIFVPAQHLWHLIWMSSFHFNLCWYLLHPRFQNQVSTSFLCSLDLILKFLVAICCPVLFCRALNLVWYYLEALKRIKTN